jgi:hypothetical protein
MRLLLPSSGGLFRKEHQGVRQHHCEARAGRPLVIQGGEG